MISNRVQPRRTGTLLHRSARLRLALSFVVILLIGATSAIVAVRALLHDQLNTRIIVGLEQEIDEFDQFAGRAENEEDGAKIGGGLQELFDLAIAIEQPPRHEQVLALINGEVYRSAGVENSPFDLSANEQLMTRIAGTEERVSGSLETPAGAVRFLSQPVSIDGEDGHFVIARFIAEDMREIDSAIRLAIAVALVFLLISAIFTFLVADRAFAPIKELTGAARRITETDLSQRIEITGSDEIAELGHTFNEMLDRLDDAFTTQQRLLRDIGHELRTPLAIASGHLWFVPETEESAEALAVVREEHNRMRRLIEDLLVLARAERRDFLVLETVDLSVLVDGLGERASHLGDRDWQVTTGEVAKVVADPQRITQAMVNLIDNAIRHTEPGDRIEIGVRGSFDSAILWVEDSGSGVPEAERERIFESFVRGQDALPGTGSGLGLAIVKHIVEAHSGTVAVTSPPHGGARFTITIPIDQPEPAEDL